MDPCLWIDSLPKKPKSVNKNTEINNFLEMWFISINTPRWIQPLPVLWVLASLMSPIASYLKHPQFHLPFEFSYPFIAKGLSKNEICSLPKYYSSITLDQGKDYYQYHEEDIPFVEDPECEHFQ